MSAERPVDVSLVEDNEGEVHLTIEGLRDGRISNQSAALELAQFSNVATLETLFHT